MDTQLPEKNSFYELVATSSRSRFRGTVLGKKRTVLGRGHHCDVIILDPTVSGIHAVIEMQGDKVTLYDLNSTNGTFVNNEKISTVKIKTGDIIRLGAVEVRFEPYSPQDLLPPVLESLSFDSNLNSTHLPVPPQFNSKDVQERASKPLPLPTKHESSKSGQTFVGYPLAQDPKAEFSEYIFEDSDHIYPIFSYKVEDAAVEIVILFKDSVISVDFLPNRKGTYYLVGFDPEKKLELVEFPYLGVKDKFEFLRVENQNIDVFIPDGFSPFHLEEKTINKSSKISGQISLVADEILVLRKNDLQIFVRRTPAPPKVKAAPWFDQDSSFRKLLFLMLFIVGSLSVAIHLIPLDEELEKEEIPDRVATIMYKHHVIKPEKVENKPVEKPLEEKKPEKIKPQVELKPEEQKMVGKTFDEKVKNQPQTTTNQGMSPDSKSSDQPKLATAREPKPEKVKSNFVAPKRSDEIGGKAQGGGVVQKVSSSAENSPNKGQVETYKSSDFSSTLNKLMAKGGSTFNPSTSSNNAGSGGAGDLGITEKISGGSPNGAVQRASVDQNVGSLTGAASGKLAANKGAEGLVDKKTVLTAGFPAQTVVLGYDKDVIRRILSENLVHFRRCYQSELDSSFNKLSGSVDLNFTIGASGHVSQAGIGNKSELPAVLINCVVNVLRGISFPAPKGGGTVEVLQPMNFYPKN